MKAYYDLTTAIKDELLLDAFVNTVTYGNIYEVDLSKQTIFPLSHLNVDSATYNDRVWTFTFSLTCMDIIDQNKKATVDLFLGNDNVHDILNTQLAVVNRLLEVLSRGSLYVSGYRLVGNPVCDSFKQRFESDVAGWDVTFDVEIANEMTKCDLN